MRFALFALLLFASSYADAQGKAGDPNAGKTPANLTMPTAPAVNSATYLAPTEPKYDYVDAMHKSYLFYWAQRSGKLPYQRLAWRGDSCLDCKGLHGEDLSGGWYEAANTMKWGGVLGFTAAQLNWNVYEFGDSMKKINEYDEGIRWVRQGADYIFNVYTTDGTTERLVGVIGDSAILVNGKSQDQDFGYYGPPEEYMEGVPVKQPRGVYYCEGSANVNKGCSDIAGDYAAALASAAVVLRPSDPVYADKCIALAKTILNFGIKYSGTYQNATRFPEQGWKNYQEWYPSVNMNDELALASAWIYMDTKDPAMLAQGLKYLALCDSYSEYSWSDKEIAAALLLLKASPTPELAKTVDSFFTKWLPGGSLPRTPHGLAFYELWGAPSYASNVAFLALVRANHASQNQGNATMIKTLRTFAVQQMNYILGDAGKSFIGGFGPNPPQSPYHISSYNSIINYPMRGQPQDQVGDDFLNSPTPNRQILYGAMVGGPEPTDGWIDNRKDYTFTEVTQDYNAAFTGALAGLIELYGVQKFSNASDCRLDLGWGNANASQSTKPSYQKGDCYHTCDPCQSLTGSGPGQNSGNGSGAASGSSGAGVSPTGSGGSSVAQFGWLPLLSTLIMAICAVVGNPIE